MIKISYSPAFAKAYKKQIINDPAILQLFENKVSLFLNDPFHPQLRTHKLKGVLKGHHAFSLQYDLRVIFYFTSANEAVFTDIGTHDEVY
jgi:mRNA interferase YafQ